MLEMNLSQETPEGEKTNPLMQLRTAIELLLHNVRTVMDSEPPEASIPVQLRAGDIRQARQAMRDTVEQAYASFDTRVDPQREVQPEALVKTAEFALTTPGLIKGRDQLEAALHSIGEQEDQG